MVFSLFACAAVIACISVLPAVQRAPASAAAFAEQVQEQRLPNGVRIVVNRPQEMDRAKPTLVVCYALPNGNTIEETEGRRARTAAEWHFDIQHIAAQTRLLRRTRMEQNIVVVYLEAQGLSWPTWRQQHPDAPAQIRTLLEEIRRQVPGQRIHMALVAHSGGGSLIFSLLDGVKAVPESIERIVLLDADYNYSDEAQHGEKLLAWLSGDPQRRLVVLAYDDRTVTLNGKPVVSAPGGAYRATHRMLDRFQKDRAFTASLVQEFDVFLDPGRQIALCVNRNYANRILHTALVGEMNGFLYGMTFGTPTEGSWGHLGSPPVYTRFIAPLDEQTPDPIPPRLPDAGSGATFMRRLAALAPPEREEAIRAEIGRGNLPDFLRAFRRIEVHAKDAAGHEHTAVYEVMPDYLAIGSDHDFYRIPMTPATAQWIADRFDCSLPTRKMVDDIYRAAEIKLPPRPLVEEREAVTTFVQHNTIIEEQRTGSPLGPIVAGIKKDIVLTNLLAQRPHRVAIYGWHRTDGAPIQPLTTVHAATYVDYSHGVRLVKRQILIDGSKMDLHDVLKDPTLAALISDEGPILTPFYVLNIPTTTSSRGDRNDASK